MRYSEGSSEPRKFTLKEKIRRVRQEITESLKMDRSADHTMDMNARPDMLGSPFPSHDDFESDAGNSQVSNSSPYDSMSPTHDDQSDTIMDDPEQLDGSGGMFTRKGKPPTPLVAAIFVHAGAGYHSVTNEQFHLGVCSE